MSEQDIVKHLSQIKFKNVISLGFFCSVAGDIERLGLRSSSGPVDWVWSTWEGVFRSFKEKFTHFFEVDNMFQADVDKCIYADREYDIISFHDFSKYKSFDSQYENVSRKYKRRIDNFFKQIEEPTLFIRYIWNGEARGEKTKEFLHIEQDYNEFLKLIKSYNKDNEVIYIANSDLFCEKIPVFYVEKDKNDAVARNPLYKNEVLLHYLETMEFENRKKNLEVYNKKMRKRNSFSYKVRTKVLLTINKYFHKEYTYHKQYKHGDYKC